jgi:hypothetical protein
MACAASSIFVLHQSARHLFGVAGVDLGAGRSRGAERQPAELKLGRGRPGAFLDQVHGELVGLFVLALLHDLEAVHDRADRADQVMTDPRTQQRGEVEAFESNGAGHKSVPPGCWSVRARLGDSAVERERAM